MRKISGILNSPGSILPVFCLYTLCALPMCFLGYGSDNDTYMVLDAGRLTWGLGILQTSRPPGYFLYEAIVYYGQHLGGYVLTNLLSFAAGAVVLWRLARLCEKLRVAHAALLLLCALATPDFLIASCSTMDYLLSLALLLIVLESLVNGTYVTAAGAGTLALALRPSNVIVLAGVYAGILLYLAWRNWRVPQLVYLTMTGVVTVALAAVFFIPSYFLAGHSFSFLAAMKGPDEMWTPIMWAGRFLYKSLYLFGVPATLLLVTLLAVKRKTLCRAWSGREDGVNAGSEGMLRAALLGGTLAGVLLFAKFPIEISYLLPAMVLGLPLAGLSIFQERRGLVAFLALVLCANFLSFSLARPNIPGRATRASLHLSVERGELLEDISMRLRLMKCTTFPCWYLATQGKPFE